MPFLYLLIVCLLSLSLTSCDSEYNYAPVTEINTIEPLPKSGAYRVKPDETIYEIAWRYGLDYRDIANHNRMKDPYAMRSGQVIRLKNNGTKVAQNVQIVPKAKKSEELQKPQELEPRFSPSSWIWPAKGTVLSSFAASHKGINIAGVPGEAVLASAPGKVVYCGHGLRGYGNLIILKHNNQYLSAYAHNQAIVVKEGEWVKQGQKIAEMGNTGANKVMLHFEIRRAGLPINPTVLLNSSQ